MIELARTSRWRRAARGGGLPALARAFSRVLLAPTLGLVMLLACGAEAPCTVERNGGQAHLTCEDSDLTWGVPFCGNRIPEAGEACDNGTRECDPDCSRRAGVSCTSDDQVCLCDPRRYTSVPDLRGATFYFQWVSLNGPLKGSHPFDGANPAVPGRGFAVDGEFGFDCDTGSTAPRLVVPPGRAHALLAMPADAIDARTLAALELRSVSEFRYLLPDEWLFRSLVVRDEDGRPYAVEVAFYATPCLGDVSIDGQLLIEYRAKGLWCPELQ